MPKKFDANMREIRSFIDEQSGKRLFTTCKISAVESDSTACSHCGKTLDNSCAIWKFTEFSEHNSGVQVRVSACPYYEPVLSFAPPLEGFDGMFTTFRVGASWENRVMTGQIVTLYDTKEKKAFIKARVSWVRSGPMGEMLKEYAHLNHSQKHNPDKAGASDRLRLRLRKLYGPRTLGDDSRTVTVICLGKISKVDIEEAGAAVSLATSRRKNAQGRRQIEQ